jgi:hypothetical protein
MSYILVNVPYISLSEISYVRALDVSEEEEKHGAQRKDEKIKMRARTRGGKENESEKEQRKQRNRKLKTVTGNIYDVGEIQGEDNKVAYI